MRARPVLVALLAAAPTLGVAQPEPAAADAAPRPSGIVVGVRGGYGEPYGDVEAGRPIRGVVVRKFPIALDLGYRFNRTMRATLQLELSPATVTTGACALDVSCSASDVRFGLAIEAHLLPRALLDPWIGVGVGVEVLNARLHDAAEGIDREWSWAGLDLPYGQAGVDVVVSRRFTMGPWATITVGRFTSVSRRVVGQSTTTSGDVASRATHRWIQGGLRATLLL